MRRAVLILATFAVAFYSGCGSDSETKTVTETITPTGSTSTAVDTATGETTGSTGGTTGPAELTDSGLQAEADSGFLQFQSPSKNIGCVIAGDSVRCDIGKKDWTAPPQPKCDLDSGDSLSLGGGQTPGFTCHGDTTLGAGPKLAYGTFVKIGDFQCESRQSGITCRDGEGDGFVLSRESYKLTP